MKIKYLIDTFISPQIQALDWVGRYGGIVRTVFIEVQDQKNKLSVKKYPIACDVSNQDCVNLGKYQDLVPNDTYKSVVYWEEISPLTNVGKTKSKNYKFKGTARIVVWLNLAKLGIDNCKDAFLIIPSIEKAVTVSGKIETGVLAGSLLFTKPKQILNQDVNLVFGKYDYDKLKPYYTYPYDFVAIDVDFEIDVCLNNSNVLPIQNPIDCPNNDGLTDCERILALLTTELKLNCLLETYDFSDPDTLAALSPQQEEDLENALCDVCPVIPRTSISFDGVNDNIFAASQPEYDFDGTTGFSYAFWIKPTTYSQNRGIIGKTTFSSTGYAAVLATGNFLNAYYINTLNTNQISVRFSTVSLVINQWVRVLITYNGSKLASGVNCYFNGILQPQLAPVINNLTGNINGGNGIAIGRNGTTGNLYFSGKIEDFTIWDKELNQTEATADAANATGTPIELANRVFNMPGGKGAMFGANSIGVLQETSGLNYQGLPYTILMTYAALDFADLPN